MSRSAIAHAAPTETSRFGPVALTASILAAAIAALLCYTLMAAAHGERQLLWSHSPSTFAFVVASLWLAAAVAGIVCGFIALALGRRARGRLIIAVVLGGASLLAVPATALAAAVVWAGPHHPADSALLGDFGRHEAQLNQAVASLRSGGNVDLGALRSAGVVVQNVGQSGNATLLPVSSWGLVVSGSEKGYAYSTHGLYPVTSGSTQSYGGDAASEIVYRHISGNWYLYYQWW